MAQPKLKDVVSRDLLPLIGRVNMGVGINKTWQQVFAMGIDFSSL